MRDFHYLNEIEKAYFPQGIPVPSSSLEERHDLVLKECDRLLDTDYPGTFRRLFIYEEGPDKEAVDLCIEIGQTCRQLIGDDHLFIQNLLPHHMKTGVDYLDFSMKNRSLMTFLEDTPYKKVAAAVVYHIYQTAFSHYSDYNPSFQDYTARQFIERNSFKHDEVSPEEYVDLVLSFIRSIERHYQQGYNLELDDLGIGIHDSLSTWYDEDFDECLILPAKRLAARLNRSIDPNQTDKDSFIVDFAQEVKSCETEYNLSFYDRRLVYSYMELIASNFYFNQYEDEKP